MSRPSLRASERASKVWRRKRGKGRGEKEGKVGTALAKVFRRKREEWA